MTAFRPSLIHIGDHAAGHQPVPDEQHDQGADGGGDEARALIGAVMADRLADEGGQKRTDDAEYRGQDEPARVVGAGRKQARDDSGDKADDDDPDNAAHGCGPFSMSQWQLTAAQTAPRYREIKAGLRFRARSAVF